MHLIITILLSNLWMCTSVDHVDKLDRYIIGCRSTDFACLKRQYRALRDNVLYGNDQLAVDNYKPYIFEYGDSGTCIQLTGWEKSELTGIKFDSHHKSLTLNLGTPVKFQQIHNRTVFCEIPDHVFRDISVHTGPLRKFIGNATVQLIYPYELKKQKGEIYLAIYQEDVNVILDIPEIEGYNKNSQFETAIYEASEWTYSVVQHIDVPKHFVLPYTDRIRSVMSKLPIKRFILLYPDEDFTTLQFDYQNERSLAEMEFE